MAVPVACFRLLAVVETGYGKKRMGEREGPRVKKKKRIGIGIGELVAGELQGCGFLMTRVGLWLEA